MRAWRQKLTTIFRRESARSEPSSADPAEGRDNLKSSTSLSTKSASVREMWSLLSPYFMESEEKNRARGRLVSLVALSGAMLGGAVYGNHWSNDFINASQALIKHQGPEKQKRFNDLLEKFGLLIAGTLIGLRQYRRIEGKLQSDMSAWMLSDRMAKMMEDNVHVRLPEHTDIKNPAAVMASSIQTFTDKSVSLGLGATTAIMEFPPFAYILWKLSGNGEITAFGQTVTVPGYMMWGALAYAGVNIAIAAKLGKPLVGMHDELQQKHAAFSSEIALSQKDAGNIAMSGGEDRQKQVLLEHIQALKKTQHKIHDKNTALNIMRRADGEVGFILPYIAAFATAAKSSLTWGQITQGAHAFYNVQGSLRFYFDARGQIAELESATANIIRLDKAFRDAAAADRRQYNPDSSGVRFEQGDTDSDISFRNLTLYRPGTSDPLLENLMASIEQGSRVIVMAPAGWGKTTLFRALAGLGGEGHGVISIPAGPRLMIVPQGRFIPRLSLPDILTYGLEEDTAGGITKKDMAAALGRLGLQRIIPDLEHTCRMGEEYEGKLSGGEAQRLAFARILLAKPDIRSSTRSPRLWMKRGKRHAIRPCSTICRIQPSSAFPTARALSISIRSRRRPMGKHCGLLPSAETARTWRLPPPPIFVDQWVVGFLRIGRSEGAGASAKLLSGLPWS